MGCPDFRGRSESSFHLARELVSGVRPVKATVAGSQAGPAGWNAPPDSEPDRHRQQANQIKHRVLPGVAQSSDHPGKSR